MLYIRLHRNPHSAVIYEFVGLAPYVSKFTGLTPAEEREARIDLLTAIDKSDTDGMQLAALKIIGAGDYRLDRLVGFDLFVGPGIHVDVAGRTERSEPSYHVSSAWAAGEGPNWSPTDIPAPGTLHSVAAASARLAALTQPPLAEQTEQVRRDLLEVVAGQCAELSHRPKPGDRFHVSVTAAGATVELVPDDA